VGNNGRYLLLINPWVYDFAAYDLWAKPLGLLYLAEYSPIPGTPLWQEAVQCSPFDLQGEPLFHNNTILPCRWDGFDWDDLQTLKAMAHRDM